MLKIVENLNCRQQFIQKLSRGLDCRNITVNSCFLSKLACLKLIRNKHNKPLIITIIILILNVKHLGGS